jgi:hypothetical protein
MTNLRTELTYFVKGSEGVTFASGEAEVAFIDGLMDTLAGAIFGEGARTGNLDSPSRSLSDLYDRCAEYTEGDCLVQPVSITGEAVELGPANYLAWEEISGEQARPVLGYDLPEVDRYYYHHFPEDTRVFVLSNGALVITHPDLMLTEGGLDEGDDARVDIPDDNDDWWQEAAEE